MIHDLVVLRNPTDGLPRGDEVESARRAVCSPEHEILDRQRVERQAAGREPEVLLLPIDRASSAHSRNDGTRDSARGTDPHRPLNIRIRATDGTQPGLRPEPIKRRNHETDETHEKKGTTDGH